MLRILVPDLDESDLVLMGSQRFHDSVDAVSGHSENDIDPQS